MMRYLPYCVLLTTFIVGCPPAESKRIKRETPRPVENPPANGATGTTGATGATGITGASGGAKLGFLSLDQLAQPTSVVSYATKEEFEEALLAQDIEANDTKQESALEGQTSSDTGEDCMKDLDGAVVKASGQVLTFDATLDIAACVESTLTDFPEGFQFKVHKAALRFYLQVTCPGKDLSALNGKLISSFEGLGDPCEGGSSGELFEQSSTETNVEMTVTSGAVSKSLVREIAELNATMREDGTPCRWTYSGGLEQFEDGCRKIHRKNYLKDTLGLINNGVNLAGKSEYFRAIYKNIVQKTNKGNTHVASGQMESIFGDWMGTITYTSADVPPTYSFTKSNLKAEGSWSALHKGSMGLPLTQSKEFKIPRVPKGLIKKLRPFP